MITLCPILMTSQPQEVRDELASAGLVPVVSARTGRWFEMRGAVGGVGVHATSPNAHRYELSFVTDDAEATRDTLLAAGYDDAHVWDESYGRVAGVQTPDGDLLWIAAAQEDFYGYEQGTTSRGCGDVSARIATPHVGAWSRLLQALGAVPVGDLLVLPDDGGSIALTQTGPEQASTTTFMVSGAPLHL